jgi:hypothetical protein
MVKKEKERGIKRKRRRGGIKKGDQEKLPRWKGSKLGFIGFMGFPWAPSKGLRLEPPLFGFPLLAGLLRELIGPRLIGFN